MVLGGSLRAVGTKRISVLVNPAAGGNRGLGRTKTLVAELADRGWTVDLLKASGPDEVAKTIAAAGEAGTSRLVLAGGDGLIHHALPALVDSGITVGIVPVGTGNDFCRGIGLPTKRGQAIDAAVSDSVASVDVVCLEKGEAISYAATVVTAGFSGRVNGRANELSDRRGFPKGASRYSLATLAEIAALEPVGFNVVVDDGAIEELTVSLIAIGNTRYFGGGMAVCPEADFSDGKMELITIDPVTKATFMRVLPLVFSGRYVRHGAVTSRRCTTLTITSGEPLWADGERLFIDQAAADGDAPEAVRLSTVSGGLRVAGVTHSN